MADLQIEYRLVSELRASTRNARTHSRKQIRQVADSIVEFGFTNPILIDENGVVLAGHARLGAAHLLKLERVPCVRLSSMTPAQKRAYALADNKLALNAGWDEEILAEELKHLLSVDVGFDVGLTGFSIAEVDLLIEGQAPQEPGDPAEDRLPKLGEGEPVTRPGDLWELGPHRLLCGSALEAQSFKQLLGAERAHMVFTDPPYNVPIDGHVGGSGAIKHREFAMAAGEMSRDQFTGFLRGALGNLAGYSVDGSIHFVCMDWRHMGEMLEAGASVYTELKNLIVWVKDNAGMGTFYRSRHELIFAFKNGMAPHTNSFELGQHGRNRSNVWQYRGASGFGAGRLDELAMHPTVKPVAMIADAIKDVSKRNDVVLDCFGGSGSTVIAAHKTGRRACLIELDPLYCDRIIRRWESYAKDDAILVASEAGSEASSSPSFGTVSESRRQPAIGDSDAGEPSSDEVSSGSMRPGAVHDPLDSNIGR